MLAGLPRVVRQDVVVPEVDQPVALLLRRRQVAQLIAQQGLGLGQGVDPLVQSRGASKAGGGCDSKNRPVSQL